MAVALGKRKRRASLTNDEHRDVGDSQSGDDDTARALFKRAFEARFRPLPQDQRTVKAEEPSRSIDQDEDENSDFNGFSEEDDAIETVEIATNQSLGGYGEQRMEKKAFMTTKIPSSQKRPGQMAKTSAVVHHEEEDQAETTNLKNDLALQRLLKEAHLLDASSVQASATAREGKGRLKALDMRLQDLGAKDSHLKQDKMPLAHRKGMQAKSASRESQRRKEATENGVIIEKAMATAKAKEKRDRGIGGPTVGKFKGGMLKLSSKDVRQIQSPSDTGKGRRQR